MGLHFMPFFVGDYLAKTRLLNGLQHGCYLLLIFELWERGRLPTEDRKLAKIACVTLRQWKKVKPEIYPYFTDDWQHSKVTKVREKALEISAKRSANALEQHSKSRAKAEQDHSNSTDLPVESKLNQTKPKKNPLIDSLNHEETEDQTTMVLRKKIVEKFQARGLTPPDNLAQIAVWLALGDSPALILATVDSGIERRGSKFTSMNYINTALELEREKAKPKSVPVAVVEEPKPNKLGSEAHIRILLGLYKKQGYWESGWYCGEKPGRPGCLIAPKLLEEFGLPPTPPYPVEEKRKNTG